MKNKEEEIETEKKDLEEIDAKLEKFYKYEILRKIIRPFKNFFHWIVKSIQYSILLWNDYDWDYSFILKLLKYKISRTRKCILKNNHIVNAEKYCKQMEFVETLIDNVLKNVHHNNAYDLHREKWGEIDVDFIPCEKNSKYSTIDFKAEKAITPELKEQERKEFRELVEKAEALTERDWKLIFRVMHKCLRNWWD
jgi:hypothetical protein